MSEGKAIPLEAALGLGLVLVTVGIGLLELARRSGSGSLVRDGSMGVRTRATMASDAAWEASQRAAAPLLAAGGGANVLVGLLLLARPSGPLAALLILVGAQATVGLALGAVARANRAAKQAVAGENGG